MNQLFAVLMATLVLLSSLMPHNDMEELVKIPSLIAHYHEHLEAANGNTLSFQDFLADHYGSDKRSHQDQDHENLPFVKHQMPGLIYIIPLLASPFGPAETGLFSSAHTFPALILNLLSGFKSHWQPPRI